MENQDWSKLGDNIRNIVQDAIDAQDYNKLNQTVSDAINGAMDGVSKGFRSAGYAADEAMRTARRAADEAGRSARNATGKARQNAWNARQQFRENDRRTGRYAQVPRQDGRPFQAPSVFGTAGPTKAGGLALTIIGSILAGGLGITALLLLASSVLFGPKALWVIAIGVILPLFIGSVVMAWKGGGMLGRAKRFQQYIDALKGRTYCEVKDLEASVGKSRKYVIKDLQRMIRRGWFKEGHLDRQGTCLIVDHKTYEQYLETERQMELKERQEKETLKAAESMQPDVRRIIEEGNEYIRKIRESNDAIPGVEISNKISRMELLVRRIFERVEQHPEVIPDIRKLMEYYLPTTVKLLDAYEELDKQPVPGTNIITAKKEIENTLDTLNIAFEKLLDSLFKDTAWDVSSDISVLHTMLAQEGLTKDDF